MHYNPEMNHKICCLCFLISAGVMAGCSSITPEQSDQVLEDMAEINGTSAQVDLIEMEAVAEAIKETLSELGWAPLNQKISSDNLRMTGLTPDDRLLEIAAEPRESATQITIRVGYYGHEADEQRFLKRLARIVRDRD